MDAIKRILEDSGLDESQIEDVVKIAGKGRTIPDDNLKKIKELDLRTSLSLETDWKKRAVLAAKIISLNLE